VGCVIARDPFLHNGTVLFSDTTHSLYADKLDDFSRTRKSAKQIKRYLAKGQYTDIEALAQKANADALVLSFDRHNDGETPDFRHYTEYKRISGKDGVTVIYRSH
jgi:hypothetical protein